MISYIKNTLLILFLAIIVTAWIGCEPDKEPAEGIPVSVGITSYIGEAATFVAKEKGFFAENGLDVTLRINNAGSESVRQLLSGDVDIAHVAETPILYSKLNSSYFTGEKQGELRIVANMMLANRIQRVVARRDSQIDVPEDIEGKRVALAGGTQSEFHLDSFLLEHQIQVEQIDTLHMSVSEQIEAIRRGEVDVVFAWEPYATELFYELGENAVALPTRLTYSTLWMATVLDQFAEDHPELVTAYLMSLKQAQEFILANPDRSLQFLAERTGVSIEIINEVSSQLDYELNLSERMLNLLSEQQRWMISTNKTDKPEIYLMDIIDFSFMEEVHPKGITIIR